MTTSENDYEIRRTIWDSKVPVEFSLDSNQSTILRTQQSTFMMLPRVGYFTLYLDEPLRILLAGNNIPEEDMANAWLLYNGEMLKWHYPIGVLYDIYSANLNGRTLPWLITVRLKDFPSELVQCFSKDVMKFNFIQSLKEANQIKQKRNIASAMTKEEHERLFDSLCNDRFGEFWSTNEKLMNVGCSEKKDVLNVPIRFYQHSFPFRQSLVPSGNKNINGEFVETKLCEALTKSFPEYADLENRYIVISHGIELPMDTLVGWMARNLSYPDNFVHVVLKPK